MRGFGSKAVCPGPDRRLTGIALSESSSTKSLTIKSLFEKFSKVKLGPLGNIDLTLPVPLPFMDAIATLVKLQMLPYYIATIDNSLLVKGAKDGASKSFTLYVVVGWRLK
jgi:hypothetical protein